ncbi:MAG: DUF3187 family protein [Thermodesulfobacteriota bacterium]
MRGNNRRGKLSSIFRGAVLLVVLTNGTVHSDEWEDGGNIGLGPMDLRSSSPGQSLRFAMVSVLPGSITPGWSLRLGGSTSNLWINEREYTMDYEILDGYAGLTYGMTRRLGFGIFYDQRKYYGGILDGFIQNFHDVCGIDQGGRDQFPRYRTRYITRDEMGRPLTEEGDLGEQLDNNGIGLLSHYVLTHGGRWLPSLGATALVHYGLRGPKSPSLPLDIGFGLGMAKRLANGWFIYGHVGYTNFGQTEFEDFAFRMENDAWSSMFAVSRQWRRLGIVAQYNFHEGMVKNYGRFHEPAHEFTLGLKWQCENAGVLEFGLIENFIIYDNSNDFGLHLAYAHPLTFLD